MKLLILMPLLAACAFMTGCTCGESPNSDACKDVFMVGADNE